MTSTLIGYFDDYGEARQTEQDLLSAGIPPGSVQLVASEIEGSTASEGQEHKGGLWHDIKARFGFASTRDQQTYAEATRHGGALLTVQVADERADQVADIIERHHPIDLDARMDEWHSSTEALASEPPSVEESIPVVQEELQVGSRPVVRGAVRIHTYVTEQPIEEQVRLTEEAAFVERVPTDRPVEAGDDAFRERTYEVTEMGEEAVAQKRARVVEEVRVGKEETSRTETVADTVRRTEVDVERDDRRKKR